MLPTCGVSGSTVQDGSLADLSCGDADGFDLAFILIYLVYLTLRMYGLRRGEEWARELSVDILAMGEQCRELSLGDLANAMFLSGAVGMFPRLAFVTLSNNLMILSLRSMMSEFFSECLDHQDDILEEFIRNTPFATQFS